MGLLAAAWTLGALVVVFSPTVAGDVPSLASPPSVSQRPAPIARAVASRAASGAPQLLRTEVVRRGVAEEAIAQNDASRGLLNAVNVQEQTAETLEWLSQAQELSLRARHQGKQRTASMIDRAREAIALGMENLVQGRFQLYNPGGLVDLPAAWRRPGERWLAVFRNMTVSPTWISSQKAGSSWPSWLSSSVVLAVLDEEMRPVRPVRVLRSKDLFGRQFICQREVPLKEDTTHFGPQDPRLFVHPSAGEDAAEVLLLFSSSAYFGTPNTLCPRSGRVRMYAASLGPDLLPISAGVIRVPGEGFPFSEVPAALRKAAFWPQKGKLGDVEKNWSPFVYRARGASTPQVLLEYSVHPHIIVDFNVSSRRAGGSHVWATSSQPLEAWRQRQKGEGRQFLNIHGGVSPILLEIWAGLPSAYLSVLHTQEPLPGTDGVLYRSFLYAFEAEPPFAITGIAERELPLLRRQHCFADSFCESSEIAFPLSLIPREDESGTALWLLYGSGDVESRRVLIPAAELRALLPPPPQAGLLI